MRAIKGQFRDSEFDRRDAEFVAAAERLRQIAVAALDMADKDEYMEPTNATGDSVEVALKSTRDAHGRATSEGPAIERDAFGRAV
jgi:hypothetical protein